MSATDELLAWPTHSDPSPPAIGKRARNFAIRTTCFEPEACGQLVQGMAFHKFYFDLGSSSGPRTTTMASPVVKFCGENVAVVAYVRLTQKLDASGNPTTAAMQETRVWQRECGRWRHVHFHRSAVG